MMRLNTIKPGAGSKKIRLRVGRGASAGQGKTCGRGVKGQRARKGGYHKVGFEGGQMPLQRRLPKIGFPVAHEGLAGGAHVHRPDAGKGRRDVTLKGLIESKPRSGSDQARENHRVGQRDQGLCHQRQGRHRDQGREERRRVRRRKFRGLRSTWLRPAPMPPRL